MTRPAWRRIFWQSSTSTKTRPVTEESSAPFPFPRPGGGKRAAPLPSVGRQEHPGVRRPAGAAARAEQHLLLRCVARPAIRSFSSRRAARSPTSPTTFCRLKRWRIPRNPDGRPRRRTAGPCRRVRSPPLRMVGEWPTDPAAHDFNPHGISARPDLNLMVTSDFMMPASSLNVVPGDPLLRGSIRVWDLQRRSIVRHHCQIPSAVGTMDVKLIPRGSAGARLHGRHVRRLRVPGRHRVRHREGRLRL